MDPTRSHAITERIDRGDLSEKPGWVRLSIHPTTTTDEAHFIVEAVREVVANGDRWARDYVYSPQTNELRHVRAAAPDEAVRGWFDLGLDGPV